MADQRSQRSRQTGGSRPQNMNRQAKDGREEVEDAERDGNGPLDEPIDRRRVDNRTGDRGSVHRSADPDIVEVDLMNSPEAAAAHASHGTTDHIRVRRPDDSWDDELDGDDDNDDENRESGRWGGRKVSDLFPGMDSDSADTVTAVGFDDGTQFSVEDGKLKNSSSNSDKSSNSDSNKVATADTNKGGSSKSESKSELSRPGSRGSEARSTEAGKPQGKSV